MSRALANLAAKVEIHFDIHHQGGLACLISAAHRTIEEVCQRLLSMAIQFLCMNFNVRNAIIKEKGLSQFIPITRQRTLEYKICAAVSLSFLSSDEASRSHVAKEALGLL